MMNFSPFGSPFSGIHQFAAKFNHEPQSQNVFASSNSIINGSNIIDNGQRYPSNSNNFNQSITSPGKLTLTYSFKNIDFLPVICNLKNMRINCIVFVVYSWK